MYYLSGRPKCLQFNEILPRKEISTQPTVQARCDKIITVQFVQARDDAMVTVNVVQTKDYTMVTVHCVQTRDDKMVTGLVFRREMIRL